jgi:hypothetical protein
MEGNDPPPIFLPRRRFIATLTAGAMAGLHPAPAASAEPRTDLPRTVSIKRQAMQNSAESLATADVAGIPIKHIEKLWTETALGEKPDLGWEKNQAVSADCAALPAPFDGNSFVMSANALKRYAALNHFAITPQPLFRGGKQVGEHLFVLFALRGAALDSPQSGWAASYKVHEVFPDHLTRRCLLGVWDTQSHMIAMFQGATVPDADWMWGHVQACKKMTGAQTPSFANMMTPGMMTYAVGANGEIPGCLVLQDRLYPRRINQGDLIYRVSDWADSVTNPGDNIHCGWLDLWDDQSANELHYYPRFSSAGCQTVPGRYDAAAKCHDNEFAAFRRAAGLTDSFNRTSSIDDRTRFTYLLLSSREAKILAEGRAADEFGLGYRLRIGSTGVAVAALSTVLPNKPAISPTRFDADLLKRLVDWQKAVGDPDMPPTGVVTRLEADRLKITL